VRLESGMKKVELVAEGFDTYAREIPTDAADIGAFTWKVQLKPSKGAHTTPPHRTGGASASSTGGAPAARTDSRTENVPNSSAPNNSAADKNTAVTRSASPVPATDESAYMQGDLGRWFVQLKSFPRDGSVPEHAIVQAVADFKRLTGRRVQACKV